MKDPLDDSKSNRIKMLRQCLTAIVQIEDHEVIKDDFAYDRMLMTIKSTAGLALYDDDHLAQRNARRAEEGI